MPGKVKTRLVPALGEAGAVAIYEAMMRRIVAEVERSNLTAELWCWSDVGHAFFDQFPFPKHVQAGSDLGAKMRHALTDGVARGFDVLLVGSDVPPIDAEYLCEAAHQLASHDVVVGPAEDGGYGLIGVSGQVPDLFSDVAWSTSEVLLETCRKLNAGRLDYALLAELWDVDGPEDLPRYKAWLDEMQINQASRTA